MKDLAAFLLARYDEREELARDASRRRGPVWAVKDEPVRRWGEDPQDVIILARGKPIIKAYEDNGGILVAEHIAAHDPASVLADLASKRAIVAMHTQIDYLPPWGEPDGDELPCLGGGFSDGYWTALVHLTAPFREHPEYDLRWETVQT